MYVRIGGIEQWIEICADNPENPVLLYLHGGPGASSRMAAAAWKIWQQYFTVVHWDQRGAGLTFDRNGEAGCGPLTVGRMVQDGLELVEYLQGHLHKKSIVIVGHSWGSILGVHMIRQRPEFFSAYVGTGQVVNMRRNEEVNYAKLTSQAEENQMPDAVEALSRLGPPPYDQEGIGVLREWGARLATGTGDSVNPAPSPRPQDMTRDDFAIIMRGIEFTIGQLFAEFSEVDLPSLGMAFDIPMFFIHGTQDTQTPIELAKEYYDKIQAPEKAFVSLEGCHHFLVTNRPELFLEKLKEHVLRAV